MEFPELDLDLLLTAAILHDVGKLDELCYERAIGYTVEGHLLGHIVMEMETVSRAIDLIEGFPPKLKTVVQHLLISHHGRYEFGSPKLPMIQSSERSTTPGLRVGGTRQSPRGTSNNEA